mgnify:CR=1 FL=1
MDEIVAELAVAGIQIPSSDVELPTVAEAENRVQALERRLGQLGNLNKLAIEQYDITEERIAEIAEEIRRHLGAYFSRLPSESLKEP